MTTLPFSAIDDASHPRPRLQTSTELLSKDLPELNWAVPFLIPEGPTTRWTPSRDRPA